MRKEFMNDFAYTEQTMMSAAGSARMYSLAALDRELGGVQRLPVTVKIILESLLRHQGEPAFEPEHVVDFAAWSPRGGDAREFPYQPARVLLQDFTGVPCVVDLAALRSAMQRAGRDPGLIEPRIPVDLVIDHSVQLDEAGRDSALDVNMTKEFERNAERYRFLRWGKQAFQTLNVLPPGLGICHQVNMEYLASCVRFDGATAFPDTLVGTDSHTVMINSMGVVGWGVGGIEAEAAMLGQPIPLLSPRVVGFRLDGRLPPSATPTDLALTVTEILRAQGVVGSFVEFHGEGLDTLSLADRAPVANMAPEYGATMGFFPIDAATLRYLRETGRSDAQIDLVERYCKEQGLWRDPGADIAYSDLVKLDLSTIEPSVAGPRRPQERVSVSMLGSSFDAALSRPASEGGFSAGDGAGDAVFETKAGRALRHGSVVIASITSCTNTSNPTLLIGAGLMARRALEKGLSVPPHVRTSFAPGSRVVTEYLKRCGLLSDLNRLGFQVAAYGCATCIGNSGPLDDDIAEAIREHDLTVAAVLSGNRNFEGRIHPLTKANYLCSPPLVLAYALAGTVRIDLARDPLGTGADGRPVRMADLWPAPEEIASLLSTAADPALYRDAYRDIAESNPLWNRLPESAEPVFAWDPDSTYIREPSFFTDLPERAPALDDIRDAAVLGLFGDFITTDHISPAGAIPSDSPAARYLRERGVAEADFNSYGSRRGNHEVMMRGTFGNIRIRNRLADGEGGRTVHVPSGEELSIYDAARRYAEEEIPLIVLAGRMYGAGSSRDWAAKGTALLGVRAVIAMSYERIHRSNLVEMGVLPLVFEEGRNAESLGLTGRERFTFRGLSDLAPGARIRVRAVAPDGAATEFDAIARIDTPMELDYFRHGGILPYVLRDLLHV